MKNTIIYIITILVSMFFGVVITYVVMTKKQMDAVLNFQAVPHNNKTHDNNNQANNLQQRANHTSNQDVIDSSTENNAIVETAEMDIDGLSETARHSKNSDVNINEYSEEKAKQLIDTMPDYVLSQYIDKFIATGDGGIIENKRRFAERAIEELYKPNDTTPLKGSAKISFHAVMPQQTVDTSQVNKFAKMYAHLDTNGKVAQNQHVFIKWVNNQTGQVLLFEKKNISINSTENWVSLIPTDGWQVGSYDVRFYQFTSELQPIAQTTYNIYEVTESS